MTADTAQRPRISQEFLRSHQRTRIIAAIARVIVAKGYVPATVADVVAEAGVARNTFYENFASKEAAALALVDELEIELELISESTSTDILAFEVAAMHHSGNSDRATGELLVAEKAIRFFATAPLHPPPGADDPHEGALPPGRHGLDPEFVHANQRARLISATADAICERGFGAVRISDVCKGANVSRRTFYEHCRSFFDSTRAMVKMSVDTDLLDGVDPRSGLFGISAEILATRLCGNDPLPVYGKALICVGALSTIGRS